MPKADFEFHVTRQTNSVAYCWSAEGFTGDERCVTEFVFGL